MGTAISPSGLFTAGEIPVRIGSASRGLESMPIWWGCSHKKLTFPMTRPRQAARGRRQKNTYVACLECGKELPYIWNEMRVVKERRKSDQQVSPSRQRTPQANLNPIEAGSQVLHSWLAHFAAIHRRVATAAQAISITPKGQAPCRKP